MNYNGLPQEQDDTLTGFERIVNWVMNALLVIGVFSLIVATGFVWGYYVG